MAKEEKDLDLKAQNSLKKSGDIPQHIAIIMDGNGRWARKRGLPRAAGHKQGVETVRDIVKACVGLGVRYLTLYTFSTENWKRPKDEITTLMRLIVKSLQNETNELNANNVRLSTIGNKESLPDIVRQELEQAIEKTSGNTKLTLNLALSYSGRWEILEAAKKIAEMVKCETIKPRSNRISFFLFPDHRGYAGSGSAHKKRRGISRQQFFIMADCIFGNFYYRCVMAFF